VETNVCKGAHTAAQAYEISYDLHTLGWKAFQDLCATITSEIWGQTVQVFFPSHDGGRDGAFSGNWKPNGNEALSGSFTVQCKFSSKRDNRLTLQQLADELNKAKRLAARGLAKNYFVMTSNSITGTEDEEVRRAFEALPGIDKCLVYGKEWITKTIRENPRLRMLVPRIYGIGDLSQILDERACSQARAILSALGEDLGKFVITMPYRQSAKALVDHRFVLLLGEPASGKSTIAAALAVGALDIWKSSALKVRDAEDFIHHWNADDPRQFFWIDDAFGVTQLDRDCVVGWNRAFPHLNGALRQSQMLTFSKRQRWELC
jgi:hypothetical protein